MPLPRSTGGGGGRGGRGRDHNRQYTTDTRKAANSEDTLNLDQFLAVNDAMEVRRMTDRTRMQQGQGQVDHSSKH